MLALLKKRKKMMERQTVSWELVHVCKHEETGVSIQVNRSNRVPGMTPMYSIRLVKYQEIANEQKVMPFIRVYRDRNTITHVKLNNPFADIITDLCREAEVFIEKDMNTFLQEDLDFMRDKEEKQANYGKPITRHTGKTDKKKSKRSA